MSDRKKNILIGIFILAAIATTIWTILFLEPSIGDGKKMLTVRFSDLSGVNIGTRVNLGGRAVGEVLEIAVIENQRNQLKDSLGRVYYYQLSLKVDSSVDVFNCDEISIRTTGLLGEKSISIIPKGPKDGQVPKIITNQILYGNSIDPLENALVQFSEMSDEIETLVKDVDHWFIANGDALSTSVKNFGKSMETADQFLSDASTSLKTDGTEILKNIHQVTKQIAEGQGTVGQLIYGDDFYLKMESILTKANTLMNDINHYGLLFGYDKKWQRQRTKRANELDALKTPQGFKTYFESEIDTVNTSLTRLQLLLEKAEKPQERKAILNSPAFRKDFTLLLREMKGLMDSLNLYNEDMMEQAARP